MTPTLTSRATALRAPAAVATANAICTSRQARLAPLHSLQMSDGKGEGEESKLKSFLADAKSFGKVRLVSTNDACVMESICTLDGLFYAEVPTKGEYANVIDHKLNLDMHLRLAGVGGARFENGVSRTPTRDPTFIVRMLGTDDKTVVLSLFLQWDKDPSDISAERIKGWNDMKEKYGEVVKF